MWMLLNILDFIVMLAQVARKIYSNVNHILGLQFTTDMLPLADAREPRR